jgi:small redox-active disulfide protein 2
MMDKKRTVEVLGPGCPRCLDTYRLVREVVEERQLDCEVVKVESMDRIVELGILRTPGIAVDGRVVFSGSVPNRDQIHELLGAD